MLSPEDNELLTKVGRGTVMGSFLREFWFPMLPSGELPAAGARPLRMRLLGEDLVVFRNGAGELGLISEFCPHRGASLYFGRNEDDGLRCVYHGWLLSGDGRCLEMPNEPNAANFKNKIRQPAYPLRELNGVVWVYMGLRAEPPPLPHYGLAVMPADQKYVRLSVRDCNWMQSVEGDLDLTHGGYLHSPISPEFFRENHLDRYLGETPHCEAADTAFGISHCARREWDEANFHVGVGHFLFPFITMFPPVGDDTQVTPGHVWIPMDDVTTLVWSFGWNPVAPVTGVARQGLIGGKGRSAFPDYNWEDKLPETPEAGSRWRQKGTAANDYGFDEEAQRTRRFSGMATVELQDRGIQESMRPVVDRTIEHLGPSDAAIIAVRRRLLQAAKNLRDDGTVPECVDQPDAFSVRAASGILARNETWIEGTREWIRDEVGRPQKSRGHVRPDALERLKSKAALS